MSQSMAFNNLDYFYKNYFFNVSPLVYLLLVELLVNGKKTNITYLYFIYLH